jgi:hypothetical protein
MEPERIAALFKFFIKQIPRKQRKGDLYRLLICAVVSIKYEAELREQAEYCAGQQLILRGAERLANRERIAFHQRRIDRLNRMVASLRRKKL